MKFLLALAILPVLLGVLSAQRCGRQGRGAKCPYDQCCGRSGWCGTTSAHCGTGCQSQCNSRRSTPVARHSPPAFRGYPSIIFIPSHLAIGSIRCGRQARGAQCPNGLCCSPGGRCGSTAAYCGTGCQSQCYPRRRAPAPKYQPLAAYQLPNPQNSPHLKKPPMHTASPPLARLPKPSPSLPLSPMPKPPSRPQFPTLSQMPKPPSQPQSPSRHPQSPPLAPMPRSPSRSQSQPLTSLPNPPSHPKNPQFPPLFPMSEPPSSLPNPLSHPKHPQFPPLSPMP